MAKKLKKNQGDLTTSRRGGEKMRRAVKLFNRSIVCISTCLPFLHKNRLLAVAQQ